MKKIIVALAVASLCSGCTYVKSPTGWAYFSVGFQKTISDMTVSTNGTLSLRGYQSKDSQIAEGIAYGVAKGVTAGANPVP